MYVLLKLVVVFLLKNPQIWILALFNLIFLKTILGYNYDHIPQLQRGEGG